MPSLDSDLLRSTLREELRAAWITIRDKHAQDGLYGFGVYTTDSASYLLATAFSEKALDDSTARHVTDLGEGGRSADLREMALDSGGRPDDPSLTRRWLRWHPGGGPLNDLAQGLLPKCNQIVRDCDFEGRWADDADMDDDEFELACETPDPEVEEVFRLIIQELQGLDREGLFGTGSERDRLVLSIWQGDQSNLARYEFAKALNPPEVAARFGREMNDGQQAYHDAWYGKKVAPELDVFD